MSTTLNLQINGKPQGIEAPSSPASLSEVIAALALKSDRIAVEHNGQIIPRSAWDKVQIVENDRLEIVHFVGGGNLSR